MTKAAIFDIDGTLADLSHRLDHVKGGHHNWDAFFAAAGDDAPHNDVCELANILAESGLKIILVSGRTDAIRGITEQWMIDHNVKYDELHMRPSGDTRKDHIVKAEILDMLLSEGNEILFVVDDRPSVVAMWRERGLTCLQCRDWIEDAPSETVAKGLLTIMVGASGAGKSTWLKSDAARDAGINQSHIVSSDQIREDLCGDFRDQSKNEQVFASLHAVAKARICSGLPTVIDATNLRRKDRLACVGLADGSPVRYIVLDRPMDEKRRDAGWRAEVKNSDGTPFDLLAKHDQTLKSQIKDILAGDLQKNVTVIDLRRVK